jgi:hypothetical protein
MKKALLAIMVVVALVAMSAMADAICTKTGRILYSTGGPGGMTFYLGEGNTPTYYYRYVTDNPIFINSLLHAQAGRRKVTIEGTATICPASGTNRDAGLISQIYLY